MEQSLVSRLFAEGKYQECINIFSNSNYLELSIEEQKLFAKSYLLSEKFDKSIEIYQKLLLDGILDAEVYCNIARSYLSLGDSINSKKHYHLLEKISPSFPPMCRGLALVYSLEGDYDNSIKYSEKFQEHFNGDAYSVADTYYQVYLSFGEIDKANSIINSLGYQQTDGRFKLLRVKAYAKNKRFNDAIKELGSISGWGKLSEELSNIGLQCLINTNDATSITDAIGTIKHDSIWPTVKRSIVEFLYRNSEINILKDFLKQSLEYKCFNPSYYSYSASVMLDMNMLDFAESLSLESFSQDSSNPICSLQLSIVYGQQSNYTEALKYALLSLKLDPNIAEAKLELTNIYAQLGEFGKACLYSLELIEDKKLTEIAFANLISILERAELYSVSLSVLNLDICDISSHTKALQTANLLRKLNESEEALSYAKEAIALNPEGSKDWSTYSAILWDLGYEQEALEASTKSLSFGETIDAMNNKSSIYMDLGRYNEALIMSEKVLKINPTHANCNFLKGSFKLMELEFSEGWYHYSFRGKTFPKNLDNIPLYSGQSSGRLLVLSEQGVGDEITFAQCYFDILKSNSLVVDVECDNRLNSLFSYSFDSSSNRLRFIDRDSYDPSCYDYYIYSGDLMAIYRSSIENFSATSKGYLRPNSKKLDSLASLDIEKKKLIGLSWKTKLKRHMNRKNCVDLVKMLTPLQGCDLTYVCLQYGDVLDDIEMVRKTLGISILTIDDLDLFNDIHGLTCLINRCNVVYTTPNVTVGLSGAIGKETHLLLPTGGPRWRWGHGSGPSYMFENVFIHRQDPQTRKWDKAIESACSMLI